MTSSVKCNLLFRNSATKLFQLILVLYDKNLSKANETVLDCRKHKHAPDHQFQKEIFHCKNQEFSKDLVQITAFQFYQMHGKMTYEALCNLHRSHLGMHELTLELMLPSLESFHPKVSLTEQVNVLSFC